MRDQVTKYELFGRARILVNLTSNHAQPLTDYNRPLWPAFGADIGQLVAASCQSQSVNKITSS